MSGSRAGRATAANAITGSVDSDVVRRQLSPGEHIEWVGGPDPAKRFTKADVFLVPFSVFWGGFAIFWVVGASAGSPHWFGLFGLPFVAVGLYFIFGRFIYKANRKRRTTYAVTNRRVLEIVRGLRGGETVNATYLRSIPNISTSTTSGGYGAVEFSFSSSRNTRYYANTGMEFFGRGQAGGVCFYDIPDPRSVADLVERLRAAKDEEG